MEFGLRKSYHGNIQKTASLSTRIKVTPPTHREGSQASPRGEVFSNPNGYRFPRSARRGNPFRKNSELIFFVEKNTWKMIYQAILVSCSETTLVCITATYHLQGSKIRVEGRLRRIKDSPGFSFNLMDFP